MVVHGGIDGYSRLVTFLKVSTNNRSETVLHSFKQSTARYGIPSRVRMDDGVENRGVEAFMIAQRGTGRGSAIKGPSVHNQRIERLWVDVWQNVNSRYHTLFHFMERHEVLSVVNNIHMFALHYTFLPMIQKQLDLFCDQYNNHKLSTESSYTPTQLWVSGSLEHYNTSSTSMSGILHEDLQTYGIDDLNNNDAPSTENGIAEGIVVEDIPCPLADFDMEDMSLAINSLRDSTDGTGLDVYLKVLQYVASHTL